ncbi:hypothetical protein HZC21_04665 [Candidatus Peregrinibacteria bacterium]|nr:hypothetical protein [Candidatus Peregrinibacteria bacterium]
MPDKFDFDKPRRYKLNLHDDVRKIPFEISCIASNVSAFVMVAIGNILNQSILRGNQEVQIIANDISFSIQVVTFAGFLAGFLARDSYK